MDYIWNIISTNEFAQGGFVIAALSWIVYQFKYIFIYIYNVLERNLLYQVEISSAGNCRLSDSMSRWMNIYYPNKYRRIIHSIEPSDDLDTEYELVKEHNTDSFIIWHEGIPIYFKKQRLKLEHAGQTYDMYEEKYTLTSFIFFKGYIDSIISDINNLYINNKKKITGVELITDHGDFGRYITVYKKFSDLFFDGKEELLSALNRFKESKDRLIQRGIKNKLGIKLYGPPGTGKTSIAIAIADMFNFKLRIINLSDYGGDKQFNQDMSNITSNTVILFEDIDDFIGFNGTSRSKSNTQNRVSFSNLLQFLDGVNSPSNVIIIMTTNKPEELDPALYRSGRIDYKLEIGYPNKENILKYISRFYGIDIKDINLPAELLTMADIENACRKCITLEEFKMYVNGERN